MINEKSNIKIDVDLSNFDPEAETGNSLDENFEMIVAAAPKYKVRVSSVMSDPEEDNYTFEASGKAGDLFRWWKDWFKICGADMVFEDLDDFDQFKEFFFLDEDETDLEASTKPSDMETLLSTVDPNAEDEYKPVSPNRIIYVYGDWADEEHEDDEVPESLKRAKEWAIKHDLVFDITPLSENMKHGAQWPGFDILGPYKTIFVWYKKFYSNSGEENEKGFRDYLFYDEYDTPQEETDAMYKEQLAEQKKGDLKASVKTNKGSLLSKSEYDPEEDMEWTDEDGEDDSEGTEWEEGELESEAGSVVIQAILELIDDQIEVLGYRFDEWMEEKKEEGYTNEDEMHDAIEWAYTRTRQAIENLPIQD